MRETGNKPPSYRIGTRPHDNGNCAGRLRGSTECRETYRDDDIHIKTDQLGGVLITFRPAPAYFEDVVFLLEIRVLDNTFSVLTVTCTRYHKESIRLPLAHRQKRTVNRIEVSCP